MFIIHFVKAAAAAMAAAAAATTTGTAKITDDIEAIFMAENRSVDEMQHRHKSIISRIRMDALNSNSSSSSSSSSKKKRKRANDDIVMTYKSLLCEVHEGEEARGDDTTTTAAYAAADDDDGYVSLWSSDDEDYIMSTGVTTKPPSSTYTYGNVTFDSINESNVHAVLHKRLVERSHKLFPIGSDRGSAIIDSKQKHSTSSSSRISFFSLLWNIFRYLPGRTSSVSSIERIVWHWQIEAKEEEVSWLTYQYDWSVMVVAALRFLGGFHGDGIPQLPNGQSPVIVHSFNGNRWTWIVSGVSCRQLLYLSDVWLDAVLDAQGVSPNNVRRITLKKRLHSMTTYASLAAGAPLSATSSSSTLKPENLLAPPSLASTSAAVDNHTEDSSTSSSLVITAEELEEFHRQEIKRYQMSSEFFVYSYLKSGEEFPVMPLRGRVSGIGQVPRPHPALIAERPPHVTMMTLARDALARMPGGGTSRTGICELLKMSQFVVPSTPLERISGYISSALDRLQAQKPGLMYNKESRLWLNPRHPDFRPSGALLDDPSETKNRGSKLKPDVTPPMSNRLSAVIGERARFIPIHTAEQVAAISSLMPVVSVTNRFDALSAHRDLAFLGASDEYQNNAYKRLKDDLVDAYGSDFIAMDLNSGDLDGSVYDSEEEWEELK